ncbi:MAG: ABC transporter ATP-binding protein [Verrucomicrobiota bacterium]
MESSNSLLSVTGLSAGFETDAGFREAVDRVTFSVHQNESVGIVGESGCGKSVTAHSILGLLPKPSGRVSSGSIEFSGVDLATLEEKKLRGVRGKEIGMIFQEPMTALNPVHTVGRQIAECLLIHEMCGKRESYERSLDVLKKVGIPAPEQRMKEYPHQLSGGMRQRVVIAMALVCGPKLMIADEPTTALDVTTQAQILDLLREKKESFSMAMILITHDLGVIAETCDRVVVMYAGRIVEVAPVEELFLNPLHRYTAGLLRSIPSLESRPKTMLPTIPGRVPGLQDLPVGARFAPRSDHPRRDEYLESEDFRTIRPRLIEVRPGHWVEDCDVVRTDR